MFEKARENLAAQQPELLRILGWPDADRTELWELLFLKRGEVI